MILGRRNRCSKPNLVRTFEIQHLTPRSRNPEGYKAAETAPHGDVRCYNRAMDKSIPPSMPDELELDPVIEEYKKHIDRSLLRRNLKLTHQERFDQFRKLQEFAQELRRAGRETKKRP